MSKKIAPLGPKLPERGIRRSVLGALLLAWWGDAQGRDRLTWADAGILAGLALGWLLERRVEKTPKDKD